MLASSSRALAGDESHHLASLPAKGNPCPYLIALAIDKGPQLIEFEYLVARCLDEGVFQIEGGYLFLSQLMTVVGDTPKVRLSPLREDRS
jgi:hypothetical protein